MVDTPLTIAALAGRWNRLGLASHFLAAREPFGSFSAAALIRTLAAQIERENCLFALDGQRVVGYVGWAVYDTDVAEKLAAGGAPPPPALSRGKDVLWVLTAAALHPDALMALLRALRAQHPGLRMMAVRHKRDGRRVVFDRAARRQGDHAFAGCAQVVRPRQYRDSAEGSGPCPTLRLRSTARAGWP